MIAAELSNEIITATYTLLILLGVAVLFAAITIGWLFIEYLIAGQHDDNDHQTDAGPAEAEYDVTPYEETEEDNVIFSR